METKQNDHETQVNYETWREADERAKTLRVNDDLVNHFLDQAGIEMDNETFNRVNKLIEDRDRLRKRLKNIHSRAETYSFAEMDDVWALIRDVRQLSELE